MITNKHIKQNMAIVLLFVYSFVLLKPLTPIINDVIAHTFYKMQHLATVHYENGKYHVHVELAKENDLTKNSSSKGTTPMSQSGDALQHLTTESLEIKNYHQLCQQFYTPIKEHIPGLFADKNSPPPKA